MADDDYLVKLVRDDIEKVVSGTQITFRPIEDHAEMVDALRRKLGEEVVEYLLSPGLSELADIHESVVALSAYDLGHGRMGLLRVLNEATHKREERGGFEKGMGMYVGPKSGRRGA